MIPDTHYTSSGGVDIAYQVFGSGPIDLVVVTGYVSNLETYWEQPDSEAFYRRLGAFARVLLFDKRGTGLSGRVTDLPTLEVRMDDVRAVMDAVGSQRAALFGWSEGGPMCALFAATYPERTTALIMAGAYARRMRADDYPWGHTPESLEAAINEIGRSWSTTYGMAIRAPSRADDPAFVRWWGRFLRTSASPSAAADLARMNSAVDIRHVLPVISVPTLVLHARGDRLMDVEEGRYMARRIPGARLVEYDSIDHVPYLQGSEIVASEIEQFLTGTKTSDVDVDRVLATVLFTDIVAATEKTAALGDRRWRHLLESHHEIVRRELARFRGREVDNAGDGFFATFDGPARAIRCACAISEAVRPLGIEVRAGLHTGECETIGEKVGGIAVHVGARVMGVAQPGEVLVSSTVKDLVAGSGIEFVDRGVRELKGVADRWRLFAVRS